MTRTRLLVSVRNPTEAAAALDGGADLIDIKEPARGPMGMSDPDTTAAIIHAVAGLRPVTVALGHAGDQGVPLPPTTVKICKVGLPASNHPWRPALRACCERFRAARVMPVVYADQRDNGGPSVDDVLQWVVTYRACGLVIDTSNKNGGLLDWISITRLRRAVADAHARGLMIGLAGSLDTRTVPKLAALSPDLIGVRGAACDRSDRTKRLRLDLVRDLKACLSG